MDLLERFAQGELEAFETVFRQFQGEVFGWIVRIVRDPGIAEDLTVETFCESIEIVRDLTQLAALGRGPGESQPTWLSIISRRFGRRYH